MKVYNWETWTCCSGSCIQAVADYHNLIYFKDDSALYVNLFVPSEVAWSRPEGEVKLAQETRYPETGSTTLKLELQRRARFPLKLRIPAWAAGATVTVNGAAAGAECRPGSWAVIERAWDSGDAAELRLPLALRMEPVDRQHPHRVAVVRGPVVMALEAAYHDAAFRLPGTDDELNRWLVADEGWSRVSFNSATPDPGTTGAGAQFYLAGTSGEGQIQGNSRNWRQGCRQKPQARMPAPPRMFALRVAHASSVRVRGASLLPVDCRYSQIEPARSFGG